MLKSDAILVIDDDDDFVFLLRWSLEKAGIDRPLIHLSDGRQALRYLQCSPPYSDRSRFPMPSLILLDLHLPLVDGLEVLQWLKNQHHLAPVPVLLLTSSKPETLALQDCDLKNSELREKPFSMAEMLHLVEDLRDHWLAAA